MSAMQCQLGAKTFVFSTTSELVACLGDALSEASYTGGPFLMEGPDAVPAWRWLGELARLRTDWRDDIGIALQHAAGQNELSRRALADLVANDRATTVLLPYTEPLVARFGTARATQSATGFGGQREPTFADVIRDQRAFFDLVTSPAREVILDAGKAKPELVDVPDIASLEALLTRTATRGTWYQTAWGDGPWGWLHEETLFRAWVPDALPDLMAAMLGRGEAEVVSALDWLSDGFDPQRFLKLLEGFTNARPPWWDVTAKLKPTGWKRPIRPATWQGVKTLGDIATRLRTRARDAAVTAPKRDLERLV